MTNNTSKQAAQAALADGLKKYRELYPASATDDNSFGLSSENAFLLGWMTQAYDQLFWQFQMFATAVVDNMTLEELASVTHYLPPAILAVLAWNNGEGEKENV